MWVHVGQEAPCVRMWVRMFHVGQEAPYVDVGPMWPHKCGFGAGRSM